MSVVGVVVMGVYMISQGDLTQGGLIAALAVLLVGMDGMIVAGSSLLITNLNDPSTLVSPAASYSISNEMTASGGLFFGIGDASPTQQAPIPSEYGLVPAFLYLSFTLFF